MVIRVVLDADTINSLSISKRAKIDLMKEVERLHKERTRQTAIVVPPAGGITLGDASRKYKIQGPTLSRWVKRGLIAVLARFPNYLYISESDVMKISKQYKTSPGRGKRTDLLVKA